PRLALPETLRSVAQRPPMAQAEAAARRQAARQQAACRAEPATLVGPAVWATAQRRQPVRVAVGSGSNVPIPRPFAPGSNRQTCRMGPCTTATEPHRNGLPISKLIRP